MLSGHINKMDTTTIVKTENELYHNLSDKWTLWAHLPHNTDWSLTSYINIMTFSTMEETIGVTEYLPQSLIENCMLFMMRHNVKPHWEDPLNRNGGCFSYKVLNKNVSKAWSELTYRIVGGTISDKLTFANSVTGITISPKKNFCIIKIWMSNSNNQDPSKIAPIFGLPSQGCLFKKHIPEY